MNKQEELKTITQLKDKAIKEGNFGLGDLYEQLEKVLKPYQLPHEHYESEKILSDGKNWKHDKENNIHNYNIESLIGNLTINSDKPSKVRSEVLKAMLEMTNDVSIIKPEKSSSYAGSVEEKTLEELIKRLPYTITIEDKWYHLKITFESGKWQVEYINTKLKENPYKVFHPDYKVVLKEIYNQLTKDNLLKV